MAKPQWMWVWRLLVPIILAFLGGCKGPPSTSLQFAGFTMGTLWNLKFGALPKNLDPALLAIEVEVILNAVDQRMSTYKKDSELSRFNQSSNTTWQTVSPELVEVVASAIRVSRVSKGAFDITVAPLVDLWGFGPTVVEPRRIPSLKDIDHAMEKIDFAALHTRKTPAALRKVRPELQIDLSAIAKGYAVDQAARYLESQGIKHYMIEVGGELRTQGTNAKGHPWSIGIEKPTLRPGDVQTTLLVSGQAVATSGGYWNHFEHQGTLYSHTLDPRTGWPVSHRLASVTVIHSSTMYADAMATALLVLGPKAGFQLARKQHLAVLFLLWQGPENITERYTEEFQVFRKHRFTEK